MEDYFKKYRNAIIGIDQTFQSPYGEKKIVYADWIASGRLYRPIEDKITNQFGPFVGNTHTETCETGTLMTKSYHLAQKKIKEHVNAGPNDVIINAGSGMTKAAKVKARPGPMARRVRPTSRLAQQPQPLPAPTAPPSPSKMARRARPVAMVTPAMRARKATRAHKAPRASRVPKAPRVRAARTPRLARLSTTVTTPRR